MGAGEEIQGPDRGVSAVNSCDIWGSSLLKSFLFAFRSHHPTSDIPAPATIHVSCSSSFYFVPLYTALCIQSAPFVLKLYKYSSRPMGYDAVIHPTHRTPSLSFTKSFAMSLSPVIQGTHERHILTLSFISTDIRRRWLTNKSTSLVRCIRCVYL